MSVIAQWNETEASFAQNYGLSLEDLFIMPWRRFRVLFGGIFSWKDDDEELGDDRGLGKISSTMDWGAKKDEASAPDLLSTFTGKQLHVGKDS